MQEYYYNVNIILAAGRSRDTRNLDFSYLFRIIPLGAVDMTQDIPQFLTYLIQIKNASNSTVMSYQRDLKKLFAFLDEKGVNEPEQVTSTNLNSYVLHLEKQGLSTATVSRNIASMKAFFHYMFGLHKVEKDPTDVIKAPHIDKKSAGSTYHGRGGSSFRTARQGNAKRNQGQGYAGTAVCNRYASIRIDISAGSGH